ncbi:MAG: AlpA family phage regulatory protein [Mesorhizobium sp.]|nr:MAG: AlpA family phage regulatory protein [Mesorhizobium sp.]
MPQPPANQNDRDQLISCQEVAADTGLGKTTIYRLMKEDRFPKPARIGKAVRWSRAHVQAWIALQVSNIAA